MSRLEIYKYLDLNGVQIRFDASFSIGFNIESLEVESGPRSSYKIAPNPFGIKEDEFETLILDYIFDTVGIKLQSLKDIRDSTSLNGYPFFVSLSSNHAGFTAYKLAFGRIDGSMYLHADDGITDLGNIEHIKGDLRLKGSSLKSLGKLRTVDGSIYIRQYEPPFTLLKTLGSLEKVGGDCILKQAPIESIGNLTHVGGNLNLRSTAITNVDSLEYVGGNLFLPKTAKDSLDEGKILVKGSIKFFSK